MSNLREIPQLVESYFQSINVDEKLNRYAFFLIRQDGVVLYQNRQHNKLNSHSIGALLGGVWQASEALSEFIPHKESEMNYRLSFDTTSDGIYIVPIQFEYEKMYLGLIYFGEINPGLIKSKIRDIALGLSRFLAMHPMDLITTDEKQKKLKSKNKHNVEKFLFEDITDQEIDRMFSFQK